MGSFKLGKMTLRSLFKKPETVLYPVETRPQPEDLKGSVEKKNKKCTLCQICENAVRQVRLKLIKKMKHGQLIALTAFSAVPVFVNAPLVALR